MTVDGIGEEGRMRDGMTRRERKTGKKEGGKGTSYRKDLSTRTDELAKYCHL